MCGRQHSRSLAIFPRQDTRTLLQFLREEKTAQIHGGIYHKVQIELPIIPTILRGLREWKRMPGYLTETCRSAQDRFKQYLDYFRIPYRADD